MEESMSVGREPLLEMFIFESNELLEQLEELLLLSEKSNNISLDNINEIFRIMHTIKGSSAMMMFNGISSIAHSVEDLFFFIRENKPQKLNYSAICDIVLASSDFVKGEIAKIEAGISADGNEAELIEKNREFLLQLKGQSVEIPVKNSRNTKSGNESKNNIVNKNYSIKSSEQQKYIGKVYFEEGCQMENIRAFTLIHNLKDITEELFHRPSDLIDDNTSSDYISQNGFDIYFSSSASTDKIKKLFEDALFIKTYRIKDVEKYEVEISDLVESVVSIEEDSKNEVAAAIDKSEFSTDKESTSKLIKQNIISVNIAKLDKLMNLVGEIVITESMVTRSPDLEGLQLKNFGKAARQLRKLNDELQDVVMSIRMIPIAATFHKMQRILRDMGKKLNKEAELVIVGEETEVDKTIIDNLSDPIMHLIRNAMDHGLESAEERIQNGKSAKGKITLEARSIGGDVSITISDDGKGLNKEKILRKARENGLITRPEADLTDREIFSYILLPGFSTKDQVTEFSGRGVGMDVVKKNIEKIGGSLSVESVDKCGTSITIKIPLTLAIIDGIQISVDNLVYILPTASVKELLQPNEKDLITDTNGNEILMIRGKCYPMIRLQNHLNLKSEEKELSKGIIVVVENDAKTICLYADKLLGKQQVVVKPLPKFLFKYKVRDVGIGGCTIMGDGSISLILDPPRIINKTI